MQKFKWLAYLLSFVMTAVISGCGGGDSEDVQSAASDGPKVQKKVSLKMASAFPGSLELIGKNGLRFSETIKEVSAGSLEVKFFEPGALVLRWRPFLRLLKAPSMWLGQPPVFMRAMI